MIRHPLLSALQSLSMKDTDDVLCALRYWSNRYKKWMVRDNTASSPQREPWVDNVEEPDEESDGNAPAIELNGETTQGNSPESPKPDPQNSENNAQNRNATLGQSHGGSVC